MRRLFAAVMISACGCALAWGEAGVIIPTGSEQPDPKILSLDELHIRVRLNNQHATVNVRQIFGSHTGTINEGAFRFSLPARAMVSDFAVWDDLTRIPGVILERKRAEEIYNIAKQQVIDPGLLQIGEDDTDEARRTAVFSAKIVPIPPFGTKRVEMEYQERIPIENLQGFFAIPLRPDVYQTQIAGKMTLEFEMTSAHPLADLEVIGKTYAIQVREKSANKVVASFSGTQVSLSEDFAIRYKLDPAKRDTLEVLAHRENSSEPGFFEANLLVGPGRSSDSSAPARTIVALFDSSLSMQWEKLERSYLALERLLRALRPVDRFHVLLFNSEVTAFANNGTQAEPANVDKALEWVRSSRLRGGTALEAALSSALGKASGPESYIVLLSDGGATKGGNLQNVRIADGFVGKLRSISVAQRPRLYVFGVGDDANLPLLKMLTRENGVLEWVRSTEPADFKLNAFLSKIGLSPVGALSLAVQPSNTTSLVYPLEASIFPGSMASWVGQYSAPVQQATFQATGRRDDQAFNVRVSKPLPAQTLEYPHLPRTWAKARVDALLEKIEREGEDRATIDEIIRLSRKYKFVTPYTSFLAAPRALLRPRLIRPGDPVLRVRTDPAIQSVVALFPFGLVKPLRYLKEEDAWQTRFLAPADMPDGTHVVRLILRDKNGRVYNEKKTFVIASKPPTVSVRLAKASYRRGEIVQIRASASETSRTVIARLYGASPVNLHWNSKAGANYGELAIPAHLSAGKYKLTVTAEDMAHNIGSQEVTIDVLP
ncbi:MAG TPA: VIT and VWA domain-containing protein [Bryobacteraceae bacterium]|nr:VIT and VWA domain-containing protein [Bryobacteraceae bacterium]